MNAFVEGLVLIGGFLAVAAYGYYAISKLEDVLNHNSAYLEAEYDQKEQQDDLNIAAANLCTMQVGAQVLKDMKNQHPNLHCTFSMGEEPELLHALRTGNVDVVIMHSKAENDKAVRQQKVMLQAQSFTNEDGVTITPIDTTLQSQFVVRKNQDHRPFTTEFVQKLCGRGA